MSQQTHEIYHARARIKASGETASVQRSFPVLTLAIPTSFDIIAADRREQPPLTCGMYLLRQMCENRKMIDN